MNPKILYLSHMRLPRLLKISSLWPLLSLAAVWVLLTGGALYSWLLGIPALVIGLLAGELLPAAPSFRIAIHHIPSFMAFFLYQSCYGGIDVAVRTLTNNLSPEMLTFPFSLSNETARVFFANVVSLLPGTLSAELNETEIVIHVLDERMNNEQELKKLERRVALMFREEVRDG